MGTVANCFAAGLLVLITIVFSKNRKFLTKTSKYYIVCLVSTAMSAILSTLSILAHQANSSAWQIILFTTLDFAFLLFTTSSLALYLIAKITEHIFTDKYLNMANVFLLVCRRSCTHNRTKGFCNFALLADYFAHIRRGKDNANFNHAVFFGYHVFYIFLILSKLTDNVFD